MHEVALAQGILEVVLDVADQRPVRTIRVRAGELQAVTHASLQFCFEMVAQDTTAAAAQIELTILPGDTLLVDGIELDDGWVYRPEPEVHAEIDEHHLHEHMAAT